MTNTKGNPMQAFDVYLGRKIITTVFYRKGEFTAGEVRRSLIEHDGMPPNIAVRGRATTQPTT
jgi:hypothetical protein